MVAKAIAPCFDFVIDLETIDCFFSLQDIRQGPRKIAYPMVENQSSTFLAQSKSLKAFKSRDLYQNTHHDDGYP